MLTRHAIQVLRSAGHTQKEVADPRVENLVGRVKGSFFKQRWVR